MSKENNYRMRWLLRKDIASILVIENSCFGKQGLKRKDILGYLEQKNVIGMVCEDSNYNIGYLIYRIKSNNIEILRIVVDPLYTHCGTGTFMLNKIKEKMRAKENCHIKISVDEENLDMQLFLKKNGFLAHKIISYGDNCMYEFIFKYSVLA